MKLKFILLIFLISLLPFSWFSNAQIMAQRGDFHFSFSPANTFKLNQYVWQEPWLGRGNHRGVATLLVYDLPIFLFSKLGIPLPIVEKTLFTLLLFVAGFSFFQLILSLLKRKNDLRVSLAAFIGANFYMFNLYSLQFNWDHIASLFAYGLAPLILSRFIKLGKKFELKNLALIGILLFLASPSLSNPLYFGFIFIILFYFLVVRGKLNRGKFFSSLFLFFIILLIASLINGFALFPQIRAGGEEQSAIVSMPESDLEKIAQIESVKSFNEGFRFLGHWGFWEGYKKTLYHPYSKIYRSPLFILLGFLISLFSFSSLFFVKRHRKEIVSFSLLALVALLFMAGPNPPFSALYIFCFKYIPGFWGFRRPFDKFGPFFIFGMAGLLSFSSNFLFRKLKNKKKYLLIGASLLVLLVVNLYAFPFWTGEILPNFTDPLYPSNKTNLPDYYQEASHYLRQLTNSFRILVLPFSYAYSPVYFWDYGGVDPLRDLIPDRYLSAFFKTQDKPILEKLYRLGESPEFIENLTNLSSLLNFDYLLVDKSLNFDFGQLQMEPNKLTAKIEEDENINFIKKFGELNLYEVNPNLIVPRFNIPQNIIYLNNDVKSLPDVVGFNDYPIRLGIFIKEGDEEAGEKEDLLNRANEIFVKGELKEGVDEKELEKIVAPKAKSVFFPYVRWKPDGFIYSMVLKKEQFDEWRSRGNQDRFFDKKLFYANKRISEIEKWGLAIDLDKALARYLKKMREAIGLLEKDNWQDEKARLQNILKAETWLNTQREKIMNKKFDKGEMEKIYDIFEELEEEIKSLKTTYDSEKLTYSFEIPKKASYQLLFKNEEFNRYFEDDHLKFEILGESIAVPIENEKWIFGGSFKLEKGKLEVNLTKPLAINLLGHDDWQNDLAESIFIKNKSITTPHLQQAFPKESTVYFKSIENYQENTFYKISFDYFAAGGEAGIILIEDVGIERRELRFWEKLWGTGTDSSRHFEKVFKSTPGARIAEFYFWGKPEELNYWEKTEGGEESKIEPFNVKIEKAFAPVIILYSSQHQKPVQMPQITFIKVNPTKYKVRIEGAKEPYTLIFSESFHQGWKAYIDKSQISNLKSQNEYGEKDIFMDRNTFETWGKKSIPEDRHYLINGYANSWYITPEDSNGKEDYEIIIEFWPQRLFYIGLGFSLVTLLSCLGYLGFSFVKNKIKQ